MDSRRRVTFAELALEVEEWLTILKPEEELENPTLERMRRVMSMVYRHGQRYSVIPRTQESNPMRFRLWRIRIDRRSGE